MAHLSNNMEKYRPNQYNSNDIFRNRWSPRAMTGQSVGDHDLMAMFEAAHWAPSSYNNQSWRFVYVKRDHSDWERFLDLLSAGNREWCRNAGALVIVISKTTFDHNGKPTRTHAFDTGAAWGMFALEGSMRGLVVHGMQGFDYARAAEVSEVPDGYEVQMMAAVGVLADPESLPPEIAAREKPSKRKDLNKLVAVGFFTDDIK